MFETKNLAFHRPKKDLCSLCETYKTGSNDVKEKLKLKYENHIDEKEEISKIKEELKEKCKKSTTEAILIFSRLFT